MSEAPSTPKPPAADTNGQLIVALTTVLIMGTIALGMIVVLFHDKDNKEAWIGLGTTVGVLGNSLTAPSGVGSVIRSAAKAQ